MTLMWPWAALIGLGAFHGINPAMGWLFAVALGLQRGDRAAVMWALWPIGLGHAAAIAVAVVFIAVVSLAFDPIILRFAAALCLIAFGVYRLVRGYRHKFRAGMQASFGDLVLWSFFMATAHGAGLMVVPVLLALPHDAAQAGSHGAHVAVLTALGGSLWTGLLAVVVHTAAMLLVTGVMAWLIYTWVGLAVLRRGWINLDLLWSGALIATGLIFLGLTAAEWSAPAQAPHHHHAGDRTDVAAPLAVLMPGA